MLNVLINLNKKQRSAHHSDGVGRIHDAVEQDVIGAGGHVSPLPSRLAAERASVTLQRETSNIQ